MAASLWGGSTGGSNNRQSRATTSAVVGGSGGRTPLALRNSLTGGPEGGGDELDAVV